jgi:hypothetical protein
LSARIFLIVKLNLDDYCSNSSLEQTSLAAALVL